MSENRWQIASRVTKIPLFTITNVLFYFLHAISYYKDTNLIKTNIARSSRHCRQGLVYPNAVLLCSATIDQLQDKANHH